MDTHQSKYPDYRGTIVDILEQRAAARPDRLAYWVEGASLSYGGLAEAVRLAAANLRRFGLGKGDIGILVLPTSTAAVISIYALLSIGAVPAVLNPALPDELVLKRGGDAGSRLVIASGDKLNSLRKAAARHARPGLLLKSAGALNGSFGVVRAAAAPGAARADPAYLQFTSGTTGEPKAAVVSHGNLISFLKLTGERFRITDQDRFVSWLPLYHDLGLVRFLFGPMFFGGPAYLLPPSMSSIRKWLPILSEKRGTLTSGPDFAYRAATRLTDPDGLDLSCLRIATNGGETIRASTIEIFEKKFSLEGVVLPTYGLAEATLGVSSLAPGEPVVVDGAGNVSCGRPYDGLDVRIVDRDNQRLENGQAGEILVRGRTVFSGYLEDLKAGVQSTRDGWFHTGDIGLLDERGHLFILGRKRALIKRAGSLIIPREIEEKTDTAEGVRFSAAIGVNRNPGESEAVVVIAEIKPEHGRNGSLTKKITAAIVAQVQAAIGFSPGDVVLVAPHTIPLTASGKIRYGRLKEIYCAGELEEWGVPRSVEGRVNG